MINIVIFDLSEVILSGFLGVEHRLSRLMNMDSEEVKKGLSFEKLTCLMKGEITEKEFWNQIITIND
jgi:hypothetical protein